MKKIDQEAIFENKILNKKTECPEDERWIADYKSQLKCNTLTKEEYTLDALKAYLEIYNPNFKAAKLKAQAEQRDRDFAKWHQQNLLDGQK